MFRLEIDSMERRNTKRKDSSTFKVRHSKVALRHNVHTNNEVAVVVGVDKMEVAIYA